MAEEIESVFDRAEFEHLGPQYQARVKRFGRNWRYYKAEVYKSSKKGVQSPLGKYTVKRISDAVLPLFTPLARAVNIDVALIPGAWRLAPGSEEQQAAVEDVFFASRWPVEGDLFVKYVVAMGEAGLFVVDDRFNERVYLQAWRPDSFVAEYPGRYGRRTPSRVILVERGWSADGPVEEATVIEPELVRTFVAGEPQGLGRREAEYANALGFVPLVECKNDPGDGDGEPTFDDVTQSLDQVNLQFTHMANIIQKHIEPQWAAFGAEAGDLEKSGDTVWFFPEGSDVKAVLAAVDFEGFLAFVQEIKKETKENLPELSFTELVGVERVAAATIELQMAEAVFKIRQLRKPVDLCLADALRLAGRAAASMNQNELAGLADPRLAFDPQRPVITIDAMTKLQIEQAELSTELSELALQRERALSAPAEGDELLGGSNGA